jgi:hypothetical protein
MPDPNKVICKSCHQPVGHTRAGVRMSPLKAAIFDTIKGAGDEGITAWAVLSAVYDGRSPPNVNSIKSHIAQINDLLEETDFKIRSDRTQKIAPHWRIVRRKAVR